VKIPHLENDAVPIVELEGDQLLGVGVEVVTVVAWAVDNGKRERFVRIDARNRDGDIVLGIRCRRIPRRRSRTNFELPPRSRGRCGGSRESGETAALQGGPSNDRPWPS
jgi:hypothetical protein